MTTVTRAKVVLKKSSTYTHQGLKWIKGVPRILEGSEIVEQYSNNGYFNVTPLAHAKKESVKSVESVGVKKKKKKKKLKK